MKKKRKNRKKGENWEGKFMSLLRAFFSLVFSVWTFWADFFFSLGLLPFLSSINPVIPNNQGSLACLSINKNSTPLAAVQKVRAKKKTKKKVEEKMFDFLFWARFVFLFATFSFLSLFCFSFSFTSPIPFLFSLFLFLSLFFFFLLVLFFLLNHHWHRVLQQEIRRKQMID